MEVFIYRHVGDDSIEAVVDPETLDLVGPQTDELLQFLLNTNVSIKALIDMSIFTKVAFCFLFWLSLSSLLLSRLVPNRLVHDKQL